MMVGLNTEARQVRCGAPCQSQTPCLMPRERLRDNDMMGPTGKPDSFLPGFCPRVRRLDLTRGRDEAVHTGEVAAGF